MASSFNEFVPDGRMVPTGVSSAGVDVRGVPGEKASSVDKVVFDHGHIATPYHSETVTPHLQAGVKVDNRLQEANRPVAEAVEAFEFLVTGQQTLRTLEKALPAMADGAKTLDGHTFRIPPAQASYLEAKKQENALILERERAHVTLNSIGDSVICIDTSDNITFLNPVAEIVTGWSSQKATGRPLREVLRILDSSGHELEAYSSRLIVGDITSESESSNSIMVTTAGKEIAIEYSLAPIHDVFRHVIGGVYVIRDVSVARAMANQITHLASHDFLTGLPNRTLLDDRIGRAIAQAQRSKKKVVVLFLDLDGFKHVNDSLGHSVGDKLLQSVGERLSGCIRAGDTVSRQ